MLKKRIIATVIVKNGIVVQSKCFENYLPVGKIDVSLEFLDKWGIDEIILLDISATINNSSYVLDRLQQAVKNCFVPLTYGGGLKNLKMVHDAFFKGADKVSFNDAFFNNQDLISQVSKEFGKQSVVLSIDFVELNGGAFVFNYKKSEITKIPLQEAIINAENLGVGEILINCVNRDGMYNGFAINTLKSLKKSALPIIIAGGARDPSHFEECLKIDNISAMAAGNMFHFVEHSVTKLKRRLKSNLIRKNLEFNYNDHMICSDQRIKKLSDEKLDEFLYEKILDKDIC